MSVLAWAMQMQQWNNGIVKNVTQNRASQRCHNIPLWAFNMIVFLYLFLTC